ncbi:MAG: hypothetical protein CVU99_15220 [Firmicutes bacterium HGW-Firmicutes-4]|nr:MAG: hypothetical protein CVU99_15220 [Firmicutes bacterium HGW-Firmicutes-4]
MSFFAEYEDLIQDINEDIEAGVITAADCIKVVRKRKKVNEYLPIADYYYVNSQPKVKYEEMRVCEVLQELVMRNMMRK